MSQHVSVVTGANSGIGRATAVHLAQQGHRVFGTVRSAAKAEKLLAMAAAAEVTVELTELDVAYPVSWGGEAMAARHDRITDGDWLELGTIEDDDVYSRRFFEIVDVRTS